MKITFLGGGNMAAALIAGLKARGYSMAAVQVVEPVVERRAELTESFGVRAVERLDDASLMCEALVLAVKPQQLRAALAPLAGRLRGQLVISIAAGVRLADIAAALGSYRSIVRAMPNTPALIQAGVTGLYAPADLAAEQRQWAEAILGAVGCTVWLDDEGQMDALTALSGSGPAYVFYLLEALIAAGCEQGLPEATARLLAIETFIGASRLAQASSESLAVLRQRVTSKGGTTAAALAAFEEQGLPRALALGVAAATQRSAQLADAFASSPDA